MQSIGFTLAMNIAVAALFAVSYVAIWLLNPGNRAPLWFAVSYGIGMLAPILHLAIFYGGWRAPFGFFVFFSLAAALLVMVPGLAVFYRRPPPWRLVAAVAVFTIGVAVALNALRHGDPPNVVAFEALHQLPYMLAMAACVWVILRDSPRHMGDLLLAGMFTLLALHFPAKAVVSIYFAQGISLTELMGGTYALISQVASGVMLVATGLLLLIKTLQTVIMEKQAAAETDPLSGVPNRRGFDMGAERILADAAGQGRPASLLLLDLDHFKAVNDTHGHAAGDAALRAFGAMLMRTVPKSALVARIGGEEFAVLLDRTGQEAAKLHAETLRLATATCAGDGVPALTVSIGVAEIGPPYDLKEAFSRADGALYAAKEAGRNCVACAPSHRLQVVRM
ncbi:diguanylate cyclase [Xanthobacter sediminis]